MKPHHCTRFKQTGSLKMVAANISITRDGKTQEASMSADTVQLKCKRCGRTGWVDRKYVEQQLDHYTLKAGVDLEER